MTRILQINASARPGRAGTDPHGSLTRRLTHRFVSRWNAARPLADVTCRDVGAAPPSFISGEWIQAAFASVDRQEHWMGDALTESDQLIDELVAADVLVIGAPLYNFGMPAALKAWIDNVVRIGRTFDFDLSAPESPYIPLLSDRPRHAVIVSARGGHGFDPGGPFAHMNFLESGLTTALGFIGIEDVHCIAIEHQETGGDLLAASIADAERKLDLLVGQLQSAVRTGAPQAQSA